jgi:hypothetical protein
MRRVFADFMKSGEQKERMKMTRRKMKMAMTWSVFTKTLS